MDDVDQKTHSFEVKHGRSSTVLWRQSLHDPNDGSANATKPKRFGRAATWPSPVQVGQGTYIREPLARDAAWHRNGFFTSCVVVVVCFWFKFFRNALQQGLLFRPSSPSCPPSKSVATVHNVLLHTAQGRFGLCYSCYACHRPRRYQRTP